MHYIITFHSHFTAMQFQNEMANRGIPAKLMPVPRFLSSSCGTCVSFTAIEPAMFSEYILQDGVEKIFRIIDMAYETAEEIEMDPGSRLEDFLSNDL